MSILTDIADYADINSVIHGYYEMTADEIETDIDPEFDDTIADFGDMEIPKHLIPENLDDLTEEQMLEIVEKMFEAYHRTHKIEPDNLDEMMEDAEEED